MEFYVRIDHPNLLAMVSNDRYESIVLYSDSTINKGYTSKGSFTQGWSDLCRHLTIKEFLIMLDKCDKEENNTNISSSNVLRKCFKYLINKEIKNS